MERRGDIARRASTTGARMVEIAIINQGRERIAAVADEAQSAKVGEIR